MKPYSSRELLLQNNLAMAATLLFRAVQVIDGPSSASERVAVIIEAEQWFKDTRKAITLALEAPEAAPDIAITAKPAAKSGTNWISTLPVIAGLTEAAISASISLVLPTEPDTPPAVDSPPLLSGGSGLTLKTLMPTQMKSSFF